MSSANPEPVEALSVHPSLEARRDVMEAVFDQLLSQFLDAAGVKLRQLERI